MLKDFSSELERSSMATRMYVCESAEHPSNLLMGLNEQRQQGQLCDVTVRVQGHLFKAHTNILASAMGYFRDLFLKPNKQVKKEIIEIPTIVNSVGFSKVLDFLYTSQLCLSQTTVMQVLCSACYLQIPYVVEKCQEFIVTHGHVSPTGSYPAALTDQRYLSDKATDSGRECELINTPPSPGHLSRPAEEGMNGSPLGNDQPHDLSPGARVNSIGALLNQENLGTCVNGEPISGSERNPASRALMQISNQSGLAALSTEQGSPRHEALKIMLQNGEAQGAPEADIDHESLAVYFVRNGVTTASNSMGLTTYVSSSSPAAMEQQPRSVTNGIGSGINHGKDPGAFPTSSASQYLLSMKKKKPKKEYRCEYCQKLFGRQQHLKRHILTHTGERPFPCKLCEKRFRRSEHLKHHLIKHQQETGVNVDGSGTATFVDFGAARKRPRKAIMPQDAYEMSKMMLVSYNNQSRPGEHSPASENRGTDNGILESDPVLLTKSNAGNALDTISERLAFAAAQRGSGIELEHDADQAPTDFGSPVALNLSSRAASHTTLSNVNDADASSAAVDLVLESAKNDRTPCTRLEDAQENDFSMDTGGGDLEAVHEEANDGVEGEAVADGECAKLSPRDGEPEHKNSVNDMSIDCFAASEVVTQDLKRLFAAMDG